MFRADAPVCGLSTLWAVTEKHFLSEIPATLSLLLLIGPVFFFLSEDLSRS
jgi:hypothetical protein